MYNNDHGIAKIILLLVPSGCFNIGASVRLKVLDIMRFLHYFDDIISLSFFFLHFKNLFMLYLNHNNLFFN